MREIKKREEKKRNIPPNRSATADPAWIDQNLNRGRERERERDDEAKKLRWIIQHREFFAVTRGAEDA